MCWIIASYPGSSPTEKQVEIWSCALWHTTVDRENFAVKIISWSRPTAKIKHAKNRITQWSSVNKISLCYKRYLRRWWSSGYVLLIAYCNHIAAFEAPCCWTFVRGGAHMCFVDLLQQIAKSCNIQAEQWKTTTVENHNSFTTYESDYLSCLSMPYLSVQAQ